MAAPAGVPPAPPGEPPTAEPQPQELEQLLGWCDTRGCLPRASSRAWSFGLFVEPITTHLSVGREIISLAVGTSMAANGAPSVFCGAINDRFGIFPTVAIGATLLTSGLWLTSTATGPTLMLVSIPLSGFGDGAITPGVILDARRCIPTAPLERGRWTAPRRCGAPAPCLYRRSFSWLSVQPVDHWYSAFE